MATFTTIEMEEFKISGISVRTTNENGKSQKDIGDLWQRFIAQNLIEQIADKESSNIYCIYTDYESDFNGAYTTIIGCRVNSFDDVRQGFIGRTIPASKYQVYKSAGKLPDCVLATWTDIWQSGIQRKYAADFDFYGPKAQNPADAEVETYVSIK